MQAMAICGLMGRDDGKGANGAPESGHRWEIWTHGSDGNMDAIEKEGRNPVGVGKNFGGV
jgi:hypothetical protein